MRELLSIGRYDEVPESLMIELVDGRYVSRGSEQAVVFSQAKKFILEACPLDEAAALTVKELNTLAREEDAAFSGRTISRALSRLSNTGDLSVRGTGKSGSPFRYYRRM